jgi:hypothetical protein
MEESFTGHFVEALISTLVIEPRNAIIVNVNNVLFIPGLTRLLMSVHEWNACGSQILYLQDRTRIEMYDDNDDIYAIIDLPPCPGATEGTTSMVA